MAYLGYVLAMPPCKMALKSSNGSCGDCKYRSCMGLAERNARLFLSGAISEQRLQELSLDLAQTCPLASCYERWLFEHRRELPIGRHRSLKKTRKERAEAVQEWLRRSCSGSAS